MARVETERDAAIARAELAEAALLRLRRVAACFVVDVAPERTWCSECRTEHRSRERSRETHPHAIGCVFASTPADLAEAQRREWVARVETERDAMSKTDLAGLALPALVERLVLISREVRGAVATGDYAVIAVALDEVRAAADVSAGNAALVLQVAEAFLRTVVNTDLGTSEKAVRSFATSHGALGTQPLAQAASAASLVPAVVRKLEEKVRRDLDNLVDVGALRRVGEARYDVRPSLRGVVRYLVEPLSFRMRPASGFDALDASNLSHRDDDG